MKSAAVARLMVLIVMDGIAASVAKYRYLSRAEEPHLFYSNGFGDHLLVLPTLRALSGLFGRRLSLICDGQAPLFLFEELALKAVLPIEFWRSAGAKTFDVTALVASICPCDLFISLVPWTSPSLFETAALLGDVPSIGLARGFKINLGYQGLTHAAESAFRMVTALADHRYLDDFAFPPRLPERSLGEARSFRRNRGRLLAVHAETRSDKRWPAERVDAALSRFLDNHPDFRVGACQR